MLDPVMVEAYGATMPINQLGTITVPEPRMVLVNVWDKALVNTVDKAIRNSGPRDQSADGRHDPAAADPGAERGAAARARQGRRATTPSRRGSRSATSGATAWTS